MNQRIVIANQQQYYAYLIGQSLYVRVYDEASGQMSAPVGAAGGLNPACGIDLQIGDGLLHILCQWLDNPGAQLAHFWITTPVPAGAAPSVYQQSL